MVEAKIKVLITTSGLGSRLGDLTKYTNKALVKVGDCAVISRIIDLYQNAEFVITLGHFGSHVKQFLELTYPDKSFEFVNVTPYEGEGSGLIKSVSFAKDKLQCPFIFHVCDTILSEAPPAPDCNWMACVESDRSDFFRTVCVNGAIVTKINEKGEMNYDFAYIGVAGVFEYELFWAELEDILDTDVDDSSDCHVFKELLNKTKIYYWKTDNYHDTGSVENLIEARKFYKQKYNVLDKYEESIHFIGDVVIKFFNDPILCCNRVKRAGALDGIVPKLLGSSSNFYKYGLVKGDLLARVITEDKLNSLINWAESNLWFPVDINISTFQDRCKDFYITKTKERVSKYLELNRIEDKEDIINGVKIPSCKDMFKIIDWNSICLADPVRFHGDFILDNMLYNNGDFVLLDWRQDFAGEINAGDKYYDLSKLNHNLTINHDVLSNNDYYIRTENNTTVCDIFRSHNMVQCQQTLMSILEKKGYNISKIKIMTGLIWLNMSPLHTYPLNKFLFYFGKYNLWRELCLIK